MYPPAYTAGHWIWRKSCFVGEGFMVNHAPKGKHQKQLCHMKFTNYNLIKVYKIAIIFCTIGSDVYIFAFTKLKQNRSSSFGCPDWVEMAPHKTSKLASSQDEQTTIQNTISENNTHTKIFHRDFTKLLSSNLSLKDPRPQK